MSRLFIILALVFAIGAAPVSADWSTIKDFVATVMSTQSIVQSQIVTCVVQTGLADKHSLDYGITTTGSLNITCAVDYSASLLSGTSANWASLTGTAYTTSFTITASPRLVVLNLAPSRYTRFRFTNANAAPASVSWFRMFRR